MHRFFTIVAVAVMLLSAPAAFPASADDPEAGEVAAGELSVDALKVNINTDDAAAIAAGLDGIGLKRAQAIVQYREANGPFRNAGELADVKGIGARTVAANSGRIEVD